MIQRDLATSRCRAQELENLLSKLEDNACRQVIRPAVRVDALVVEAGFAGLYIWHHTPDDIGLDEITRDQTVDYLKARAAFAAYAAATGGP